MYKKLPIQTLSLDLSGIHIWHLAFTFTKYVYHMEDHTEKTEAGLKGLYIREITLK